MSLEGEQFVVPEVSFSPEVMEEAEDILYSGKFIDYAKSAYSKMWLGDYFILEAVLLMEANARVDNSLSHLHLNIIGKTQVGKSVSAQTALKFLDVRDTMTSTMTKMWIFYGSQTNEVRRGMVILSDDTTMTREIAEVYRNVLTSWDTGTDRKTLVNQKTLKLVVPPRVSFIFTNTEGMVDESNDAQDESRFLVMEITRTEQQMDEIAAFSQRVVEYPTHQMDVIKAIWTLIAREGITVQRHREFARNGMVMRDFKRMVTLVMARAVLYGRDYTTEQDYNETLDFLSYSKPMVNSTTAAPDRNQAAVLSFLQTQEFPVTCTDISAGTGMSQGKVYNAIRGREGRWDSPKGGLMTNHNKLVVETNQGVTKISLRR